MIPLRFSTASTTIRFSFAFVKVALVHWSRCGPPKGRLIATEPAAPSILNWGHSTLDSQAPGLFEKTIVVQDLSECPSSSISSSGHPFSNNLRRRTNLFARFHRGHVPLTFKACDRCSAPWRRCPPAS